VFLCTDWSLDKFGTFSTQHKSAHDHQRMFRILITAATFD